MCTGCLHCFDSLLGFRLVCITPIESRHISAVWRANTKRTSSNRFPVMFIFNPLLARAHAVRVFCILALMTVQSLFRQRDQIQLSSMLDVFCL